MECTYSARTMRGPMAMYPPVRPRTRADAGIWPGRDLAHRSQRPLRLEKEAGGSNFPLRIWVWAIYLETMNLKGVSSMKVHRDLDITQKTVWHLQHRIRTAFLREFKQFTGPVEVDETYIGGLEKNNI